MMTVTHKTAVALVSFLWACGSSSNDNPPTDGLSNETGGRSSEDGYGGAPTVGGATGQGAAGSGVTPRGGAQGVGGASASGGLSGVGGTTDALGGAAGATDDGGSTSQAGATESGAGGTVGGAAGATDDGGSTSQAGATESGAGGASGGEAAETGGMAGGGASGEGTGGNAGEGGDGPFIPPEQWIIDPSFEEPELGAWTNWPYTVSPGRTTDTSLFIDSEDESTSNWIYQIVDLHGFNAAQATFSAYIKTEDVVAGENFWERAALSVEMLDAEGAMLTQWASYLFFAEGTQDYTYYEDTLMVPLGTAAIKVVLSMSAPATGRTWFDDVELRLAPPSTDDDVTVPEWIPPTGEWCARPGYGLGTVMDADWDFDTQLHPNDPDIAKNKRVASTLFTQVTQASSTMWCHWAEGDALDSMQLEEDALAETGALILNHFGLWHSNLPATGIAYDSPDDISTVLKDAGFEVQEPYGNTENSTCLQAFKAPESLDTYAHIRERMMAHVSETIGSRGGRPMWAVINEIAYNNGQCFPSAFADPNDTELEADIRLLVAALDQAELASPGTIGIYNDFSITDYLTTWNYPPWPSDVNREKVLSIIEGAMAQRGHIDGIGSQSHLMCKNPNQTDVDIADCAVDIAAVTEALDAFTAAGVPLYITEFEFVAYRDWANPESKDEGAIDPEQQAELYADYISLALNHPGVLGFTIWGHRQGKTFPSKERDPGMTDAEYWSKGCGLYDDLYQPKPAYDAVVGVLNDYYAEPGCDYIPGAKVAAVRGDAVAETRFAVSGAANLLSAGDFVLYLFNTPYGGTWQLDLQIEADEPGPNVFQVTIDDDHAAEVEVDASEADGALVERSAYASPISLGRGTHVVKVALASGTDSCEDTVADTCDSRGIVQGIRLRRLPD